MLQKIRRGDRDVDVSLPDASAWHHRQPVLVDDIVSSARTMIQAVASVRRVGLPAPLCIGVHALFAPGAYEELLASKPARVLTCDTVPHASNEISVVDPMARALEEVDGGNRIVTNNRLSVLAAVAVHRASDRSIGRPADRAFGPEPVAPPSTDAGGLQPITFADPATVQIGDFVLAVGDPFGVGQTVTQIIATGRVSRGWLGVSARDVIHETTGAAAGASLVAVQRGGPRRRHRCLDQWQGSRRHGRTDQRNRCAKPRHQGAVQDQARRLARLPSGRTGPAPGHAQAVMGTSRAA